MNNLRDIVRRHVERETLRDFLEDKFDTTPQSEKDRWLDKLRANGHIDHGVNEILDAFLREIEKGSPKKQKKKWFNAAYSFINLALTALIAYAVNILNWPTVVVGSLILLVLQLLNIFVFE